MPFQILQKNHPSPQLPPATGEKRSSLMIPTPLSSRAIDKLTPPKAAGWLSGGRIFPNLHIFRMPIQMFRLRHRHNRLRIRPQTPGVILHHARPFQKFIHAYPTGKPRSRIRRQTMTRPRYIIPRHHRRIRPNEHRLRILQLLQHRRIILRLQIHMLRRKPVRQNNPFIPMTRQ